MAPPADEIMGTAASGEKLVMPQTRKPKKTLVMQIMDRIDQLISKKTGVVMAARVRTHGGKEWEVGMRLGGAPCNGGRECQKGSAMLG